MADPIHGPITANAHITPNILEEYARVFYSTLHISNEYFQQQLNNMVKEAIDSIAQIQDISLYRLEDSLSKHVTHPHKSNSHAGECSKPKSIQNKLDQLKAQHQQQKESNRSKLEDLNTAMSMNPERPDSNNEFGAAVGSIIIEGMVGALNAQEQAFMTALASTTEAIDIIYTLGSASIASKVAMAFEGDLPKKNGSNNHKNKSKKK